MRTVTQRVLVYFGLAKPSEPSPQRARLSDRALVVHWVIWLIGIGGGLSLVDALGWSWPASVGAMVVVGILLGFLLRGFDSYAGRRRLWPD